MNFVDARYMRRCQTTMFFVSFVGCWLASASDPSYDERYNYRFKAMTGYELSEDGVREALKNIDSLRLDDSMAAIAVVGEMRYTSLIPLLKEIYAREPLEKFGNRQPTNIFPGDLSYHPMLLDPWKAHVVRALIRCRDPDATVYALEQAARAHEMSIPAGPYAIRNLKYLLHDPTVDVVSALKSIIDRYSDRDHLYARVAGRELAELEHYFRLTADPRRAKCTAVLDDLIPGSPPVFRAEIQSLRMGRPLWVEGYAVYSKLPQISGDDYPMLDEIVDFILSR